MSEADDDLTRARTELGEPEELFHVSGGWLRTKLIVAMALIVGGGAANAIWLVFGVAAAVLAKLLLMPPIIGFVLLWHMYRNRGLIVLVYPTGLLRLRRGEVDSFPWPEVEQVKLKAKRSDAVVIVRGPDGGPAACWLPVDMPSVQLWTAGFTLARADGHEAHFGPALADYPRLAETVQRETFSYLWPGARDRFLAGEAVAFGDLEVTASGLRHEKKFLPWRAFKELTIAQGRLTVKQDGRWLPWVLLDPSAVPNPHVLFALVAEVRALRAALKRQPHQEDGSNSPQRHEGRTKATERE